MWNSHQKATDRRKRCKWFFAPKVYRVRIDDAYYQQRYEAAAEAVGEFLGKNMTMEEFFVFAAEYLFRHYRELAPLRSRLRKRDNEDRVAKRNKERARRKADADSLRRGLWRPE